MTEIDFLRLILLCIEMFKTKKSPLHDLPNGSEHVITKAALNIYFLGWIFIYEANGRYKRDVQLNRGV